MVEGKIGRIGMLGCGFRFIRVFFSGIFSRMLFLVNFFFFRRGGVVFGEFRVV